MFKEGNYRITVIMGIYNCASTLVEALDSLYTQTYKNFKIILCDDGSTDNTYQVAQNYSKDKKNIILIKNEHNLKLAATLNRCLEFADTEYVARMDGDDISLPTRFEKEINFLDYHPEYALVSCPMVYFDETGDWKEGKAVEKPQKNDFKFGTPFCHAPVMMRTNILKQIGGYTSNKLTERREDYYLWYNFYANGYIGYNLQEHLYKMRNDINAFKRRKPIDRWRAFILSSRIRKRFKIRYPYICGIPSLLKIFIPASIANHIRKL